MTCLNYTAETVPNRQPLPHCRKLVLHLQRDYQINIPSLNGNFSSHCHQFVTFSRYCWGMYRIHFPRTLILALVATLALVACSGALTDSPAPAPRAAVEADNAAPADRVESGGDVRPQFLNAYADW